MGGLGASVAFFVGSWFGWMLLIVAGVFAFAAFHYVCWGRWLGKVIREEMEAEEQLAAAQLKPPPIDNRSASPPQV